MLKLAQIDKAYGAAGVLRKADLCCEAGEAVCIAGANAAGKTTLLSIAAGLLAPDSGHVECGETPGYVPQETALPPELTVREALSLWYAAAGRGGRELFSPDAAETALGLLPHARKRIGKLSGGLKKRASIACALAGRPRVLLLDEPFTALDLPSRAQILELLRALRSNGCALLFSSHDPSAVAALADRVLLLQGGSIAAEETLSGTEQERTSQVIALLSRV